MCDFLYLMGGSNRVRVERFEVGRKGSESTALLGLSSAPDPSQARSQAGQSPNELDSTAQIISPKQ